MHIFVSLRSAAASKPGRFVTTVALALIAAGCGPSVGFMAQSVVSEDGTLQRTTRFRCGRCSEELVARYLLPADGHWGEESYLDSGVLGKRIERTRSIYRNDASYDRGQAIPSDFVRKGQSDNARNQITITTRDFFLVKTYAYEERFSDITNLERFLPAANKLYMHWVDTMARTLDDALGPSVDRATAGDAYASAVEELYRRTVAGVEAAGMQFFDSDEAARLEEEWDEETIAAKVAAALAGERPTDISEEEWFARIEAATDSDVADKILEPALTEEAIEAIFGAHGFTLFEYYGFEVSAMLPGDIYQSNATGTTDGALAWDFDHEAFILEDYVISARSRIVYPQRIIAGSITLLALLLFSAGAYLWGRRRGDVAVQPMA